MCFEIQEAILAISSLLPTKSLMTVVRSSGSRPQDSAVSIVSMTFAVISSGVFLTASYSSSRRSMTWRRDWMTGRSQRRPRSVYQAQWIFPRHIQRQPRSVGRQAVFVPHLDRQWPCAGEQMAECLCSAAAWRKNLLRYARSVPWFRTPSRIGGHRAAGYSFENGFGLCLRRVVASGRREARAGLHGPDRQPAGQLPVQQEFFRACGAALRRLSETAADRLPGFIHPRSRGRSSISATVRSMKAGFRRTGTGSQARAGCWK